MATGTNDDRRPDVELIRAAAAGDDRAFAALYHRHKDWAHRVARRFAPDADSALDAVQEAFLTLAGKIPSLVLRARLTTYLYPIVKNAALTIRRKSARLSFQQTPDRAAPADTLRAGPGQSSGLESAVAGLPDGQREVLILRAVDGMSLVEIASALGIPEGTVKSRLHHAIRTLREDPRTRDYFQNP